MNVLSPAGAASRAQALPTQRRCSSSSSSVVVVAAMTTQRRRPSSTTTTKASSSSAKPLLSPLLRSSTAAPLTSAHRSSLLARNSARKTSFFFTPRASSDGDRSDAPLERVLAAAPYIFPLLDGLRYGRYLFQSYPITRAMVAPLAPIAQIYYSVPFASLVLFFAIYLGLVQQTDRWSRFVRFNAMQAVLLDILLIFPGIVESAFKPPAYGAGLQIYISLYNTVWIFCFASFVVGVFGALVLGKTVRLPIVAEAADQQVRF